MAHKKGGGSSRNGRDSESKRLGVKKYGGEWVRSGNIILWRLFASREDPELTKKLQLAEKGSIIKVYGQVFSAQGNAPWIDVMDVQFEE